MEKIAMLMIPALLGAVLLRVLLAPLRLGVKAAAHSACGFVCLWLLNSVAPFTGLLFPINTATVLIAGFLGLPGMALMALLAAL